MAGGARALRGARLRNGSHERRTTISSASGPPPRSSSATRSGWPARHDRRGRGAAPPSRGDARGRLGRGQGCCRGRKRRILPANSARRIHVILFGGVYLVRIGPKQGRAMAPENGTGGKDVSKRRFVPLSVAVGLTAALATAAIVGSSFAAPGKPPVDSQPPGWGLVSDVGRFNDKGFNQNQRKGLLDAKKHVEVADHDPGARVPGPVGVHSELHGARPPGLPHHRRRRLPAGEPRRRRSRTSSANIKYGITDYDVTHPAVQRQGAVSERDGLAVRHRGEQLPRRLPGGIRRPASRGAEHQRRRRRQDPAGRLVPRRVPRRRPEVRTRDRPSRSTTRRTSSIRRSAREGARPDLERARRSCSTSRVRAASARSTLRRSAAAGGSASTSTSPSSAVTSSRTRSSASTSGSIASSSSCGRASSAAAPTCTST